MAPPPQQHHYNNNTNNTMTTNDLHHRSSSSPPMNFVNESVNNNANDEPPPYFSMGLNTYQVSMSLHSTNRMKLFKSLRNRKKIPSNYIVYLEGGRAPTRYDTDHEPIFRQESYFNYLFGVKEPDCSGCIRMTDDNEDKPKTVLFIPRLPKEYATFMGRIKSPEEFRSMYNVDEVLFNDDVERYLLQNLSSSTAESYLLLLKGLNTDSGNTYQPPNLPPSLSPYINTDILHPLLSNCRVIKSPQEISLLRHVTHITSLAHTHVMRRTQPHMMEYQLESLFKHFCYYHYGHRHVGYTSICGCGPNAAILHYGHAAAPNDGMIMDRRSMCLMDMGSEYHGYGADVTCSYPVGGIFVDEKQRGVYEAVLAAQKAVIGMMAPGVSWVECHLRAERAILEGLMALGVVKGDNVGEMVDRRLGAVFMPHGLGHFIGCDTHDVGGYLEGYPERSTKAGLNKLRTSRVLEEGMVITVEPGCYFIDHLIDEMLTESGELKSFVVRERLEEFRGFGRVRLEDVVLVTSTGCENLTNCPRTVQEVEHVMSGGKWPPLKDEAPELKRIGLTKSF